ncbi:MAG: MarR family transcriptional regulator [bacterium]
MPSSLRDEIKQTRPFKSLEEETLLSIDRTAALLLHRLADTFKPHDITITQYNVLRILRGAGAEGLCRNEIRDRLIAQVPDVTRLLDRLEQAGLLARERASDDRRVVTTRITTLGLALLQRLDAPVAGAQQRALGHMNATQLRTLIDLLALARTPA